jgi:dTDP-4-amino-4,6-dideoxygalactose transaminase
VKLQYLDRWNEQRCRHAAAYGEALSDSGVRIPRAAPWAEHVWHLYAVRSPARDRLRSALASQGIATGIHYPVPLHRQPALARLGYPSGAFPVTEAAASELLSLPMFAELEPHEIEQVAGLVAECQPAAA